MVHCRMIEPRTFYQATEQIRIDSPVDGIIYSEHQNITIVPQVVRSGENQVVAIRNTKLVTVEGGEIVGIVMPFPEEEPEEVAIPLEEESKEEENSLVGPSAELPADVPSVEMPPVTVEESPAEAPPVVELPLEASPKVVEPTKSQRTKSK